MQPAAFVVAGGDQPVGAAIVSDPFEIPRVAAVKVNVTVCPAELADTSGAEAVNVPEPSGA